MIIRRFFLLVALLPLTACGESASLWAPENLHDWCIVPFDASQRAPAQRAAMVEGLGLKRVAYDWRDQHVPEFEDEILQYREHGIEMLAFWGEHEKAFALFEKYAMHPQIWIIAPAPEAPSNEERIRMAADQLLPLVERTRQLACPLALYNHGGWSGEPENMAGIVAYLRAHHSYETDCVMQFRRCLSPGTAGRGAASVVRQADCNLMSFARPRFTFARMSDAAAVQMNGLGLELCAEICSPMAWVSSSTLRNTPRRMLLSVRSLKNLSTMFIHDALVGVKWKWN